MSAWGEPSEWHGVRERACAQPGIERTGGRGRWVGSVQHPPWKSRGMLLLDNQGTNQWTLQGDASVYDQGN